MSKWLGFAGCYCFSGATLITVPKAFAQNAPRYMVSAVDLEIAPAVCTENSNPHIMVMKPAEDCI
jgi:hypothetical protein